MKDIWGAMADPTRREILNLLRKHDMTAGEIADKFEISNATISHHLKILREAELVTAEKEKQTITYRLNMTVFQEFLAGLAAVFGKGEDHDEE